LMRHNRIEIIPHPSGLGLKATPKIVWLKSDFLQRSYDVVEI
jgi:hypothetical protein